MVCFRHTGSIQDLVFWGFYSTKRILSNFLVGSTYKYICHHFFFKQVGFAFPKKQCHRVPQSAAVQGRGFKTIRFQNPKRNANLSLNIIEINVFIMILILKALFGATTNSSANQKLADKLQNRKEHQWWHRADAAAWDVEGQRLKKGYKNNKTSLEVEYQSHPIRKKPSKYLGPQIHFLFPLITCNSFLAKVNSLYKMAIFGIYVGFLGCIFFWGFAKETPRHTKPLCVIITSLSIDFEPNSKMIFQFHPKFGNFQGDPIASSASVAFETWGFSSFSRCRFNSLLWEF